MPKLDERKTMTLLEYEIETMRHINKKFEEKKIDNGVRAAMYFSALERYLEAFFEGDLSHKSAYINPEVEFAIQIRATTADKPTLVTFENFNFEDGTMEVLAVSYGPEFGKILKQIMWSKL
jgi:hypothetical protein